MTEEEQLMTDALLSVKEHLEYANTTLALIFAHLDEEQLDEMFYGSLTDMIDTLDVALENVK